jgi:methyl-accepting chemotaxis protein
MDTAISSSTSSLSRRIVVGIGVALLVLLTVLGWAGSRLIRQRIVREADGSLLQAAEQAALVIDRIVAERERQVRLLASLPPVVDAARVAADRAARLGLPGLSIEAAESRFDSTRTLDVDPRTGRFLRDRSASLDLAEVLVTDVNGFNAITTERTSDFVQNDEEWWRQSMAAGLSPAEASFDESAQRVSISVSAAVRETDAGAALGVMKVVYGLSALLEAVRASATADVIAVELIDGAGRVIASSILPADLKPLPGFAELPREASADIVHYRNASVTQRASIQTTNASTWRVVAHTPERVALADLRRANLLLTATGLGVLLLLLGALATVNGFMNRRIAAPAAALAAVTESVAAGDLSVRVAESTKDDEIGRLTRATMAMIGGLRTLTVAIKTSAREAAEMALDLTASSEEIAASSQEMAQTSIDLSRQSQEMAQTIQEMAGDSTKLVELSTALASGVTDGVQRNQRLRALARENRQRLDASARELEALVGDVQQSVAAAESLAASSVEIRDFVELVQRMARQSKLLAFSAAMEASRAGLEGTGFAVVAKEVERLATTSSEAAERTDRVVNGLLAKVEESRVSSAKAAAAAENVRKVNHYGVESFAQVEQAVADTEAWTTSIEAAARTSSTFVESTKHRLEGLARGTEAFAAAMEEVAASAQEQSASTEEITGTAAALSSTAERLTQQAGAFRLEG